MAKRLEKRLRRSKRGDAHITYAAAVVLDVIERYFTPLPKGTTGQKLITAFKNLMKQLMRDVRSELEQHSAYFWIHGTRRYFWQELLDRHQSLPDPIEEIDAFRADFAELTMRYHRATIAALKYSALGSGDWTRSSEASIRPVTPLYEPEAIEAFRRVFTFMDAYQGAVNCLKRAEKGGRLRWINSADWPIDVVLDKPTRKLAEIYDARIPGGTFLGLSGAWAPTSGGFLFPRPDQGYDIVHPWASADVLPPFKIKDDSSPVVLTLVANLKLRERVTGAGASPWLFRWFDLAEHLPRIQFRDELERLHQRPSQRPAYGVQDVLFGLSALTYWQRVSAEPTPERWLPIMMAGYSIWTDVDAIIKERLLPHFMHLRTKNGGCQSAGNELARLLAVIAELTWDEDHRNQLDLRLLAPARFILRLDARTWLLDWTSVDLILSQKLGNFGWVTGTAAQVRGRDFEHTLAEHLSKFFEEDRIHGDVVKVVWRGDGARKRLMMADGSRPDLDLGIVAGSFLLAIEIKSFGGSRDLLFAGTIFDVNERWRERVQPALDAINNIADHLARRTSDLKIPPSVRGIIPLVCCPFPEWIVSLEKNLWIFDDIPCVCTPDELLHMIDLLIRSEVPKYYRPIRPA